MRLRRPLPGRTRPSGPALTDTPVADLLTAPAADPPVPVAESAGSREDGNDSESMGVGSLLKALAIVGPPVSVATALLFYFGWTRTATQAAAMGLDDSIFEMSNQDYIIRSLDALYLPVLVGSATVLAWVIGHGWLITLVADGRAHLWLERAARLAALSMWALVPLLAVLVTRMLPAWAPVSIPISLAVGVLLSEYAGHIRRALQAARGVHLLARPAWVGNLRRVLVGVIITSALFWEVAEYAGVVGRGRAAQVAASVGHLPLVTIYARADLAIDAPGVHAYQIGANGGAYHVRYSGLHLLQHTGGKYFLLPDGWAPGSSPLIVIDDDPASRLEFTGAS